MYTYFLKKYDFVKLGNFLSKKCKVSFFAMYSTILCKRKSDYNILRTGKMLLFSSSMGAMHGDIAEMHTLLL